METAYQPRSCSIDSMTAHRASESDVANGASRQSQQATERLSGILPGHNLVAAVDILGVAEEVSLGEPSRVWAGVDDRQKDGREECYDGGLGEAEHGDEVDV